MKHVLAFITALALVATNSVFADESPDLNDPKVREKILKEAVLWGSIEARGPDGAKLVYARGSQAPYIGWLKQIHINGKVAILGHYKDGKADGPFMAWHKNGQKEAEYHYTGGKPDGLATAWHENGEKAQEGTFKDGKLKGLYTRRYNNGQESRKGAFWNGKQDGPRTFWRKDGQKWTEGAYKAGEKEGPWT